MRDIWFCKFGLCQSEVEHDGVSGFCRGCHTPVVRLQTQNDIFNTAWFPLAEIMVSSIAPPYGAALKGLEKIDESNPPEWLDALINLAAVVIIGVVGVGLVKELRRATS